MEHICAGPLERVAEFGGYFAMPPATDDWMPCPRLLEPATILRFVADTRAAVACSTGCDTDAVPIRVAASSFQLAVAARIFSPIVAAASCYGDVPRLGPQALGWRAVRHSPAFAWRSQEWTHADDPAAAAELIADYTVAPLFEPLHDVLRDTCRLSPQVAWGNLTSAVNGAVTVLAITHPQTEPAGRALVRALLQTAQLTGTGEFGDRGFVRRSCCLFYQAPRGGLCGDCVLT